MICCVTGHRPKGFPFLRNLYEPLYKEYLDKLYCEIQDLIKDGYTDFITGMAEGADIDFAEYVIAAKNINTRITLEAALPYPVAPSTNKTPYGEQRDRVLKLCDNSHTVSTHYYRGCMQKRNRYMVDKSDIILAIWNGKKEGGTWDTIRYAQSKEKTIRYIMLTPPLL